MINNLIKLMALVLCFCNGATAQTSTINILSWNVFLMPAILADDQMSRVDSIATYLNNSDSDILILQEVFHKRSRRRLIQKLDSIYPYYTDKGPRGFWRVPSGCMVFSKYKLCNIAHTTFKAKKGDDALAKKGVISMQIEIGSSKIQVFATHLQAGSGKKREQIRQKQLDQIASHSQNENTIKNKIFAGDFNIKYLTNAFNSIREKLSADLIIPEGQVRNTSNFKDQNLFKTSGDPQWIDFIFMSPSLADNSVKSWIDEPKYMNNGQKKRLSDHNPIYLSLKLENQ